MNDQSKISRLRTAGEALVQANDTMGAFMFFDDADSDPSGWKENVTRINAALDDMRAALEETE